MSCLREPQRVETFWPPQQPRVQPVSYLGNLLRRVTATPFRPSPPPFRASSPSVSPRAPGPPRGPAGRPAKTGVVGRRFGSSDHGAGLGGVDEAPRVPPLPRPGRRLGRHHLERDGAPGAGRIARYPSELAGDDTARGGRGAPRRRARAGGTLREGTR